MLFKLRRHLCSDFQKAARGEDREVDLVAAKKQGRSDGSEKAGANLVKALYIRRRLPISHAQVDAATEAAFEAWP
jgi:hypothetical protein